MHHHPHPAGASPRFAHARSRVIPEIDTPGHVSSMCAGYPWLCPSASCTDVLAPYDATFDLLGDVFATWKELYPDK